MASRGRRIKALGVDDLEATLREALEAYDSGWTPHMFIPTARQDRMERVRTALADVDRSRATADSIDWSST